jgi:hypothetical protein
LFLSNAKLGQDEIWSASQQGYHLPPQKFQRNPHHRFGFMIKSVKATATGNFAANFVVPVSVRNTCASSQRQRKIKWPNPFLTSKQDKKSHGVPDDYEVDAGNFEFAPGCLQPIQPTTLFLN